MDHRSFLKSLPPSQKANLAARSNASGLVHLAGHLALIIATGTAIAAKTPLWWALLPVHGVLITFLFCLAHEASHRTPFESDALNDWVGRLAGLPILLPFVWFRYFHFAHHRFTNDPARDPELLAGAKPESWPALLLHVSGLPFWRASLVQLWQNATTPRASYLPDRALPRIRREARALLVLYGVGFASLLISPALLWLWIVPALIGQPVLRVYLLAEHGRCPQVADMFANTRTTYTARAIRFLAWNMPFHAEHHAMPQVPFHRLPELAKLTAAHLKVTEDGYIAATRTYLEGMEGVSPPSTSA